MLPLLNAQVSTHMLCVATLVPTCEHGMPTFVWPKEAKQPCKSVMFHGTADHISHMRLQLWETLPMASQVVELTESSRSFLRDQFRRYDANQDLHLSKTEQDEMFSASPSWYVLLVMQLQIAMC